MSELPAGWADATLEELVDVLDSVRVPLNAEERDTRIAGKRPEDLFPYYGATGQVGYIDDFIFDEPLILLGEDGVPFLDPMRPKAYRVSGKCWVNNHAHVLRARTDVSDERFVAAFLNAFDYTGHVSGSTRLKLTQGTMRAIPVRFAPLNEQKRIADKLDAVLARVDACRERLDRVPAILKRFGQAVLTAATSGKVTEEWRNGNGIGIDSWETKAIEELVTIKNGRAFPSAEYGEDGVRLLRPGNLHVSGRLEWNEKNTVLLPSRYMQEFPEFVLGSGELLMNLTAQSLKDEFLGRVCLKDDSEPALLNQRICAFYPKMEFDVRPYLFVYLKSPDFRRYVDTLDSGTLIKHMHSKQLLKHKLQVPTTDEQVEIIRRVESLFAYAYRLEARYTAAHVQVERLTSALLAKAFRGELVPQDPSDEPASVLLERIRAARAEQLTAKQGRKPPVARVPRAPKEKAAMTKSRQDDDVQHKPYLAVLLREAGGSTSVEDLFRRAELPVTDFYKQLAWEVENGHIRDDETRLEAA